MTYETTVLGLGPVGYWPMNDDNGQAGPVDVSGSGWDLSKGSGSEAIVWTLDPEWNVMVLGGGVYFGGGDPVILENLTGSIDTALPFSLAGWFKNEPGNNGGGDPDGVSIASVSIETGTSAGFTSTNASSANPTTWSADGGASDAYTDSIESSTWLDTWRHVALVSDGTTIRLYCNGVEVNTGTITAPGDPGYPYLYAYGFIAHVAIFDRDLSAPEVALLAGSPTAPPPPTTYLWDDFDRTDGGIGTASPVGFPWTENRGTWAIDSNEAIGTPASDALATLDVPVGQSVRAAEVSITVPATTDWTAGLLLGAGAIGGVGLVAVPAAGGVYPTRYGTSGITNQGPLATVDTSAGTHVLSVQVTRPTATTWEVTTWWDDEPTGTITLDTIAADSNSVALMVAGADAGLVLFDDLFGLYAPIEVPAAPAPELTGGVAPWVVPPDVIFVPEVPAPALIGGVAPVPLWSELGPIFPGSAGAPPLLGGVHHTYSDTPNPPDPPGPNDPPWPPGVQPGPPTSELNVTGRWALSANCRPTMNDPGSGSFICLPEDAPALGDEIGYSSGGSTVFTGYADVITDIIADPGEEPAQVVTVETPGMLGPDWSSTVVYPDIGAYDPIRVGQPAQDDRIWGWPMNGLNTPGLNWTTSVGGDNDRFGTAREIFPLPDEWPDNRSQFMWTTEVDTKHAPAGWCYFRQPFGSFPGPHTLFLCAYDYARVYIDGVLVATADQAGQTVRANIDFDWDFHLCAVEAYNAGGRAGVMLSIMRRGEEGFGGTGVGGRWLTSGSGWAALERPKVSMRSTVGKIIRRLVDEADARGAPAGRWTCSFSDDADSAGRPWPTGEDASLITTKVGSTYLDVLAQFSESLIDYWPDRGQRILHAYNKGTGGSAGPIPWSVATDHTSAESYVTKIAGR